MSSLFSKASKLLKCKYLTAREALVKKEIAFFEDYISKTVGDPNNNSVRKLASKVMQDTWLPADREELKSIQQEMSSLGCK